MKIFRISFTQENHFCFLKFNSESSISVFTQTLHQVSGLQGHQKPSFLSQGPLLTPYTPGISQSYQDHSVTTFSMYKYKLVMVAWLTAPKT